MRISDWSSDVCSSDLIGTDRAMVISGVEGLDELSLAGGNAIAEIERDVMRSYIVSAADVGLPVYPVSAIKGGNPAHNATELRKLLLGEHGPYRDAVLFNSAAALVIAGERSEDQPSDPT